MSWQDELLATLDTPGDQEDFVDPEHDKYGTPHCSERCPNHDGKRCQILGYQPRGICEPAVVIMLHRLRRAP